MRRMVWAAVAAVAVVGIAVGLWAFQPWKVFTSSELHEDDPLAVSAPASTSAPMSSAAATSAAPRPQARELAAGEFVSQEHATSGTARIIERADGTRVLRVQDLASSDGPDVHVWLTDVEAGLDEWGAYDDGRYVRLGKIKATHGDHNYEIPADADLDGIRSVVLWCDRFNVAFGSAEMQKSS